MRKITGRTLILLLATVIMAGAVSCSRRDANKPVSEDTGAAVTTQAAVNSEAPDMSSKTEIGKTAVSEPIVIAGMTLPVEGEVVNGFRTTRVEEFPGINGYAVYFEHERVGTKVVFIACDDIERGYAVGVPIRPEDDRGEFHILEHLLCCGSKKRPNPNMLFDATSELYSTFINAYTTRNYNLYPFTSLSEEQTYECFDMTMDCLLNPLAMEDERIFEREGWRYVPDENGDLSVTGAVFNEMFNSVSNVYEQMITRALRTLYPGSPEGYVSGGLPDCAMELTWEDIKSCYERYYHPSDMLIELYGKLDHTAFLKKLDEEYLSGYSRRETDLYQTDPDREEFTEVRESVYKLPVSADSSAKRGGIAYSFDVSGMDIEEVAVLVQALKICDRSVVGVNSWYPPSQSNLDYTDYADGKCIVLALADIDTSMVKSVKESIDQVLLYASQNGFRELDVEYFKKVMKRNILFSPETTGASDILLSVASAWASEGSPYEYSERTRRMLELIEGADPAYLRDLVKRAFLDSDRRALTVIEPVPGMLEEYTAAIKQKASEYRDSLSEAGRDELMAKEADYLEWLESSKDNPYIRELDVVDVKDLNEEYKKLDVTSTERDGVTYTVAKIDSSDYCEVTYYLDASAISQDDVPLFALYAKLLSHVNPKGSSVSKLLTNLYLYTAEWKAEIENMCMGREEPHPMLKIGFKTLIEDADMAQSLLETILFDTDFADISNIKSTAQSVYEEEKRYSLLSPDIYTAVLSRAMCDEKYMYDYYVGLTPYLQLVEKVTKMSKAQLTDLGKRLEEIKKLIANKNGMMVAIAASEENIPMLEKLSEGLTSRLSDTVHEKVEYTFDPLPRSIALVNSYSVYSNYEFIGWSKLGLSSMGDAVTASMYISSELLMPELRGSRGAYGVQSDAGYRSFAFGTMRDPNVRATFEYFDRVPELMTEDLSQDKIDKTIIAKYSEMIAPKSELTIAEDVFKNILNGLDPYEEEKQIEQIKAVTVDGIIACAEALKKIRTEGCRITIGGAEQIEANRDLYDAVYNLLTE